MSYTVVTTKVDPQTKKEAMKTAEALGLSLSAVMKSLLKQFIRTKRLEVGLDEEPSNYLLESIRQSEEDIKAGRGIAFKTGKDALEYLDAEIEHGKYK